MLNAHIYRKSKFRIRASIVSKCRSHSTKLPSRLRDVGGNKDDSRSYINTGFSVYMRLAEKKILRCTTYKFARPQLPLDGK